jgi:hypothetical protein
MMVGFNGHSNTILKVLKNISSLFFILGQISKIVNY